MSSLSQDQIYQIIKPCGLGPKKSQAIKDLSLILVNEYNSIVPDNFVDLEKLPGVGHKTASVVMSQGFGVPAFAVDTHIHRLAQRWGLTDGKNVKKTEADLKKLFDKSTWNKLHLQIIYYGREFCKARDCYGIACKICTSCYPNRKKPVKTKVKDFLHKNKDAVFFSLSNTVAGPRGPRVLFGPSTSKFFGRGQRRILGR